MLDHIQSALFQRALDFREAHTARVDSLEALVRFFRERIGFVITPWCGRTEDEDTVKAETGGVTTRVILPQRPKAGTVCSVCGRPANSEVVWGRAY